ncbi:MAG: hypothetical protein WAN30_09780 [Acidimicrobiales bacterium]
MFHRFSTWWRALSVVLLSLATVTWPSAAHAETTALFILEHQSPVVELSAHGTGRFDATLRFVNPGKEVTAQVSLYPRVIARSQLAPIISGAGDSDASIATTGNFTITCLVHDRATFGVALFSSSPGQANPNCENRAARLRLNCTGQNCDGVYPISYSISALNSTQTTWSLLSVQAGAVPRRLEVGVIEDVEPPSLSHPVATTAVLRALSNHAQTPVTITADYRTLSALQSSLTTQDIALRTAYSRALSSPLHRGVAAPPASIDFAGLVSNGFATQVNQQLSLSTSLLRQVTGRYADSPVVLNGDVSLGDLKALAGAHVGDVVVHESSLALAPSSTLDWGAPFRVPDTPSLTVLAIDGPIDQLVNDRSINPGLRTVLTLNSLAFLHYEEPNAPSSRTVIIEMSPTRASSTFVNELLDGLDSNPFAVASSLAPLFSSSLIGANGAPEVRDVTSSVASTWSGENVNSLLYTIGQISSFNQAISSAPLANALSVDVAQAEVVGSTPQRQAAINQAQSALDEQLANFSVDQSSITLAGPGTALPVTVLSRADYSVTAVVHLITDRLSFPKGSRQLVTLDSPTKSLRIPTANHRGSDLTLQIVVTTPNGQVTLARAAIQVRIAGNSIVGYLLSIGSLLVLAFWWLRTHRRSPKGRHAR